MARNRVSHSAEREFVKVRLSFFRSALMFSLRPNQLNASALNSARREFLRARLSFFRPAFFFASPKPTGRPEDANSKQLAFSGHVNFNKKQPSRCGEL